MAVRKNHILDALGDVHDVVDGFANAVDGDCDYDDGARHEKKEARAVALNLVDGFMNELEELKELIKKKYT